MYNLIRYIVCSIFASINFGVWMKSFSAGMFIFFITILYISIEMEKEDA